MEGIGLKIFDAKVVIGLFDVELSYRIALNFSIQIALFFKKCLSSHRFDSRREFPSPMSDAKQKLR